MKLCKGWKLEIKFQIKNEESNKKMFLSVDNKSLFNILLLFFSEINIGITKK